MASYVDEYFETVCKDRSDVKGINCSAVFFLLIVVFVLGVFSHIDIVINIIHDLFIFTCMSPLSNNSRVNKITNNKNVPIERAHSL